MRVHVPLAAILCLTLAGCASRPPDYTHSRFDYWVFRARAGKLAEPNYLPWMMHRERLPGGSSALVACRWPASAFPLKVHIVPPELTRPLQDEFNPRDPKEYVHAVERALSRWEEAVGRPVRFSRTEDPSQATLRIELKPSERLEPGGRILGRVRKESERCRVVGPGDDDDHVAIEYAVLPVELFILDSVGLLTPRQVETVALHEIGHVLGASGQHSPLRGDVMYRIADDRRVEKLSEHDINSFRALYGVPPGAIYAQLDEKHVPPVTEVRRVPPKLGPKIADERFGFSVRFPVGWQSIRSPRGWVAVDGLSWDYDASLQVIALRGSVEGYLQMSRSSGPRPGAVQRHEILELDGQPMARITIEDPERTEVITILDWRKGWMIALLSDCPRDSYALYQPWFWSVVLSLDHIEASVVGPSS